MIKTLSVLRLVSYFFCPFLQMGTQLVQLLVVSLKNDNIGSLRNVKLCVVLAISAILKTQHYHRTLLDVEVSAQFLFYFMNLLYKTSLLLIQNNN